MKYRASIDVEYAPGEALAADAHRALTVGIEQALADATPITVTELAVVFRRTATLTVEGTLAHRELTNPLDALTCLTTAFDKVLWQTGMLEEFDIARRRLTVSPCDHVRCGPGSSGIPVLLAGQG
ncbi:MAG: hypothetical protein J2P19_31520 [Pseudonocardia sp.]|nr:hypothetical protein [Pseudonocardia sp.]